MSNLSQKNLQIKNLISKLNEYRDSYYNNNRSLVTDKEYDDIYDELVKLESDTGIIYSNSPTQTVGYIIKSNLTEVTHSHPMLSLNKTKDVSDLMKFTGEHLCLLSCKMDGLTVLLTYDDGKLTKAETRGDGEIGEDITHNAMVFDNIPLTIENKNHIEIEGEAIITYEDFEKINTPLVQKAKEEAIFKLGLTGKEFDKYIKKHSYGTPRNLASGSVRQLDSSIAKSRHIKFIAWKLPFGMTKFHDGLDYIEKLGFEIVPYIIIDKFDSLVDYMKYIDGLKSIAEMHSYPIDGLVITYDNVEYGKSLGMTGHHPKHSLAFKFEDEEYESNLIDIEWTIGKTGVLTPTAVFEPVEIDGTIVERASLSNLSVAYDTLGLPYVGQTVFFTKRNQIIPKIEHTNIKYDYEIGNENVKFIHHPVKCPVCGAKTAVQVINNSKNLICTNDNCKGKLLGKLCHFVSKNAMNIDGLSEATLKFLIDKGWVYRFKDLFDLRYVPWVKEWKDTIGYGDKSVDNILDAIDKSSDTTLDRLLNALSIPNIGKQTAKDIAKYCNYDIDKFKTYMLYPEIFYNIDGIGDSIIGSLKEWYNISWIDFLSLCYHLNIKKPISENSSVDLSGKAFCITGSLNIFKNRDEAVSKIESVGGKVTSSVSKKTSYLVNNDINSTSSKNKKAKELGIPIITEEELISLLRIDK